MKAVFLDIDGVLQPWDKQARFDHQDEIPEVCKRLNEEHPFFDYIYYAGDDKRSNRFMTVGAVYYDWHEESVELFRRLLDETGARIVLSTDWRAKGWEPMRGLLAIHGLDKYLYGMTAYAPMGGQVVPPMGVDTETEEYRQKDRAYDKAHWRWQNVFNNLKDNIVVDDVKEEDRNSRYIDERTVEIIEYLDRHPEITSFVAIDDRDISCGIASHFVKTWPRFKAENLEQCKAVLAVEDGPYHLHTKEGYDRTVLDAWRQDTYGK